MRVKDYVKIDYHLLLAIFVLFMYACTEKNEPIPVAELQLESLVAAGSKDIGTATFYQKENSVVLTIQLRNMWPGRSHAVHIHQALCGDGEPHFNMGLDENTYICDQLNMGERWGRPFAGDVGNIEIDENGNGSLTIESEFWSFGSDNKNITNCVIYIHLNPEDWDFECGSTHPEDHVHNNPQIAMGVIPPLIE